MRVLLKNRNGLFYQSGGAWTSRAEGALDFKRTMDATEFAVKHHLDPREVLLSFGDHAYDIRLPLLRTPMDRPNSG